MILSQNVKVNERLIDSPLINPSTVDPDPDWFYDLKLKCWEKLIMFQVDREPELILCFQVEILGKLKKFKINPVTVDLDPRSISWFWGKMLKKFCWAWPGLIL